jgi:DNA-binding CsgD family transcriptional regulator
LLPFSLEPSTPGSLYSSPVFVAWKAQDNWCAAVLALAGCWMCASATSDLSQAGFSTGSAPPSPWVIALTQGTWMLYYLPLAWLMLIFPTGRLLTPRWRAVLIGLPLVVVIFNLTSGMAPGPYADPFPDSPKVLGTSEVAGYIAIGCLPIFLALLVASVASMVQRYRRAGMEQKLQLRWMAVAGLTVPLTLLICWLSYLLLGKADLVVFGLVAMYLAIPAAAAIAIVRSRLFDVDQLLIRGAVYAGFAVLLVGALGLVSGLAGWWLGRDSVALAVAVTVLVLLGCLPLRRRAERRVAAWLFPDREQPLRSLEQLQADVHAGARPPEALEQTLQDALRDPALRVGYLLPGRTDYLDQHGNPLVPQGRGLHIQMAGDRIATVVSSRHVIGWSTEIATTVGFLSELVRLRLETGTSPARGRGQPPQARGSTRRGAAPPGTRPSRRSPTTVGCARYDSATRPTTTPGTGWRPGRGVRDREQEVLALMAEGLTNAGIARRLWLTERTVESHIRNLMTKLGIVDDSGGHRRVLAVLTFLEARGRVRAPES